MIEIVHGVVGGGKTIYAVQRTIDHLSCGGTVWTNVDMQIPEVVKFLRREKGVVYRTGQINMFKAREGVTDWYKDVEWGSLDCPVLCIIDEAHLFYNAKDHAQTAKQHKDMLSFLSQSRKAGIDVVFISQDKDNMDTQFRRQAQIVVLARNMAHMKVPGLGISLKGIINYSFHDTKTGMQFKMKWWRLNKKFFALYKTEAFLDSLMAEMAATKDRLSRVQLRRVPFMVRLYYFLNSSDKIEQWIAAHLRGFAIGALQKQRIKKHESNLNPDLCVRGNRIRRVSSLQSVQREDGTRDRAA